MRFHIRPYRDGDFEQELANIEVVAAEARWIGMESPVDAERWRARIERELQGGVHLVVEAEGRVVGSGGLRPVVPGLFEVGMSLLPDWRGRGLGRALLARLVAWAQEVGAYKLTLQVWPHNAGALHLYKKFGFEREGYLRRHWRRADGELWDSVVMGLLLEGKGAPPPQSRAGGGGPYPPEISSS